MSRAAKFKRAWDADQRRIALWQVIMVISPL